MLAEKAKLVLGWSGYCESTFDKAQGLIVVLLVVVVGTTGKEEMKYCHGGMG